MASDFLESAYVVFGISSASCFCVDEDYLPVRNIRGDEIASLLVIVVAHDNGKCSELLAEFIPRTNRFVRGRCVADRFDHPKNALLSPNGSVRELDRALFLALFTDRMLELWHGKDVF